MLIDLAFPLQANAPIASDHGYFLYSAISHTIPQAHAENGLAIHPIRGQLIDNRKLAIQPWSRLVLRMPHDDIPNYLKLAGRQLRLAVGSLRVGVPEIRTIVPSTALRSRLVIIKVANIAADALTPEAFEIATRKQLSQLGLSPEVLPTIGKRRTMRLKEKELVGYEVIVEGLTAEESLTLQEHGIGGKRHMGCGVFLATSRGLEQ